MELTAQTLRVYFDEQKPLILATDASFYNVGAALMLEGADGKEHVVTCTSQTLSSSEQRYAQIENKAFSIVFGFKRFRQYVMGREVILYNDHKPQTFIFKANAGVLQTAFKRIQRWSLNLANYSYVVRHPPVAQNSQADALSSSPKSNTQEIDAEVSAIQQAQLDSGPGLS